MRVGLTGVFGAGKSTVAAMMAEMGAVTIDADRLAREICSPGSAALEEIAQVFGPESIGLDGELNRSFLAARIFSDTAARERMNRIVHPRVRRLQNERANGYEAAGRSLIVCDVPLLFEAGFESDMDVTAVVWVEPETLIERLIQRRSMSRDEIEKRLSAQMSAGEKRARADELIDNSGVLRETRERVEELMDLWRMG